MYIAHTCIIIHVIILGKIMCPRNMLMHARPQCENDFQLPFWSKADHKWANARALLNMNLIGDHKLSSNYMGI